MTSIVIDTDPGIDDLFAVLMALGSEQLSVRALLSTCGNVGIEHTTRNLLGIAALANRSDIPVYRGAERPISGELVSAGHVHGEDGIGGAELPQSPVPPAGDAIAFLTKEYAAVSETVVVCLGPMTNLAMALQADASLASHIPHVVAMGGGFSRGNVTPHAEFNIWCDPVAAAIVFASGIPVTLIPLDATLRTVVTPDRLQVIRAIPRIGGLLAHVFEQYRGSGVLHDPNTIAWLEHPELYRAHTGVVSVVEAGEEIGRTVYHHTHGLHTVAFDVDAPGFFDAMTRNLQLFCSAREIG